MENVVEAETVEQEELAGEDVTLKSNLVDTNGEEGEVVGWVEEEGEGEARGGEVPLEEEPMIPDPDEEPRTMEALQTEETQEAEEKGEEEGEEEEGEEVGEHVADTFATTTTSSRPRPPKEGAEEAISIAETFESISTVPMIALDEPIHPHPQPQIHDQSPDVSATSISLSVNQPPGASRQDSYMTEDDPATRMTSLVIPVIAVEGGGGGGGGSGNVSDFGENDMMGHSRLSKSASNSSISRSAVHISTAKRRLSIAIKVAGSLKRSSNDLAQRTEISTNQTKLVSSDYGTSFSGFTASANVAEGTLIAHLPTIIHLDQKPSVASPHVMDPSRRNTLMGRRMDSSPATSVVQSLLTPVQRVAAKAPSATSSSLAAGGMTMDAARQILSRKLRQRKLDNLANIALAAMRQMKKARQSTTEGPDHEATLEGAPNDETDPDANPSDPSVPSPITKIEVVNLNRKLPERRPITGKGHPTKSSLAWDTNLPILLSHIDKSVDVPPFPRATTAATEFDRDAQQDEETALTRSLPQRPWTMASQIPVPTDPRPRRVEIVSVSLADISQPSASMADNRNGDPRRQSLNNGNGKDGIGKKMKHAGNAKMKSKKMTRFPVEKEHDKTRKLTVLTRNGMKLEVKADKFVIGDDMTGVLSIKRNTLRSGGQGLGPGPKGGGTSFLPTDPTFEPQKGPNLPGLESRPITSLLKKRFNEWDSPIRHRPDDYFSQYSQPLPITRDNKFPQKQATKRHHLLHELRLRREYLLQEVYLGQTAVSPKLFLKQIKAMEKSVQDIVGGKSHQTLTPTFSTRQPCHELFNELGQIHWKERAKSRKGNETRQYLDYRAP
ncbi:hypothetical protein HDU97_006660 [Phlyctochytrium planicorne]|nr:hypothetical protein HDU97_006660 [Phlyctochytrium planicorne]